MEEKPPVSLALDKLNLPHQIFRHPGQVMSFEQAAQERGHRLEQVVRSILFNLGKDQYLMALVAGPPQVSWKKLRQYTGRSRVRMATEDEVFKTTGYRIGTVSPFGLPQPIKILIDPSVMNESEISIGSGMRNIAIILKSSDLLRGLKDAEIVQLIDTP
jgi:Cys-tRNA(Pro)/Cys-tRNA(Cys) deacylase